MGDVIPFPIDHSRGPDDIQFICIGCDHALVRLQRRDPFDIAGSRRSARDHRFWLEPGAAEQRHGFRPRGVTCGTEQGKRPIPVLVGDARMPSPDVLPDELEALAYLNAMRLRPDPDFTADVARLIAGIAAAEPVGPPPLQDCR